MKGRGSELRGWNPYCGYSCSLPGSRCDVLGSASGLCEAQHFPGSLELRMEEETKIASPKEDVTMLCALSSDGTLNLAISVTGVRWSLRRSNSDKEDKILEYNGKNLTQFRPGANISMSGLRRGDASLFLPSIQLREGGEYRCEIIIPPDRFQGTARLDVVAQSSSTVLPPETVGEKKKGYTRESPAAGFHNESVQNSRKNVIPGTYFPNVNNSEHMDNSSISNNDEPVNPIVRIIMRCLPVVISLCLFGYWFNFLEKILQTLCLCQPHYQYVHPWKVYYQAGQQQDKSERHSLGSDHLQPLPPQQVSLLQP
ncbi:natural cytotoxicity triggering receptor 3 ligand 1 [Trichosurus vulpecula]|uniref:natural cytotoxicity triggering receptor 3 ligand 1 n=1 Tax=Trichosurus vulpecula TaxID=9337 RepID=UPI00186B0C7E|nr:natural cytotoxicity triggering receptor 3 ligand 1 [Trichosurus vulpecula]